MNALATIRYFVFAFFIVCNAILASVAVWNSGFGPVQDDKSLGHVDGYLVAVGALGLALTFSIIFTELLRRNAFTSRVWFEIAWTSLFFMMNLAGAAVLSVFGPPDMCQRKHSGKHDNNSNSLATEGSCTSTRILEGFAWLSSFILLIYLVFLLVLSFVNRNNESVPRIWQCTIHNFPPLTVSRRLASAPATPVLPRFTKNDNTSGVVAPTPMRPNTVPSALYSLRSIGLGSQYQIEHFNPPAHSAQASVPHMQPILPRNSDLSGSPNAASNAAARATMLYPQYIASPHASFSPPARTQTPPAITSPPPLGDWPRADAPLRVKPKRPGHDVQNMSSTASPPRPSGPRSPTSNSRPPPLDLSAISALRDRERRQQDR